MSPIPVPSCPSCGRDLSGGAEVEGLCTSCLLARGLSSGDEELRPASGEARMDGSASTMNPVSPEVVHTWMPASLVRQAAGRLRWASIGTGLAVAVGLVLNLAIAGFDVHTFSHPRELGVVLVGLLAVSGAVIAWTEWGRLVRRSLIRVGISYEIAVALLISFGDHLEPLPRTNPLASVSWLCVWIAIFPLVVPALPRWAFLAGSCAAATWPVAWGVLGSLGYPVAPRGVMAENLIELVAAVGLAYFATRVVRKLQDLGCYRLIRKLDHGGMGEIWEARHRMLARPVAIKRMRLLGGGRRARGDELEKAIRRFGLEAQATAALRSPHTVELHDFGVTAEGEFYYVMELLEGLDLESLVEAHGALPPERVVHLLLQACDSLAEAHSSGLIHRDIKPGNIFACHVGLRWDFVKVLDFGLVKPSMGIPGSGAAPLTQEGTFAGTPAYLAPEVALGRSLDARVDIYCLGCVGYWLLSGTRPFEAATAVELVADHVRTPPVPPSQRLGRPVPEVLERLVLACMAKNPDDRPATAEWLAGRLAECRLDDPWTPERARQWWESRGGAGVRGPSSLSTTSSLQALGRSRGLPLR